MGADQGLKQPKHDRTQFRRREPLPPAQVSFLERRNRAMATSTNQSAPETPVVRTTTQARQGITGHGVRYVLVISTAAIVVIFAALWLFYFH